VNPAIQLAEHIKIPVPIKNSQVTSTAKWKQTITSKWHIWIQLQSHLTNHDGIQLHSTTVLHICHTKMKQPLPQN